jgi:hypothetical protein
MQQSGSCFAVKFCQDWVLASFQLACSHAFAWAVETVSWLGGLC